MNKKFLITFLIAVFIIWPASVIVLAYPLVGSPEHQEQLSDYWNYIETGEIDFPPYEYDDRFSSRSNQRRKNLYESNQESIVKNELFKARALDLASSLDSSINEGYQSWEVTYNFVGDRGTIISFSVDGVEFLTTRDVLEQSELSSVYWLAEHVYDIENPESYVVLGDLVNEFPESNVSVSSDTTSDTASNNDPRFGGGTSGGGGVSADVSGQDDNETSPDDIRDATSNSLSGNSSESEGVVPCGGPGEDPCDFDSLIELAKNVIDLITIISIPLAVIGFAVAGFKILTAGADPGKVSEGRELLMKIAIGFFFILAAWLIVNLITSTLFTGEGFNLVR